MTRSIESMRVLSIDIETYSSADLAKVGVYRYAEASDFTILLFAYAFDDEPVQIVDLASGGRLPGHVMVALESPVVLKTAFNANFERTCIAKHFGIILPPEQWECTMVRSAMAGLPLSLDAAAKVLKLEQEKMSEGKALIRYFSIPCKPTKTNGGRTRNLPEDAPEKWETFTRYCIQDVVVEREIRNALSFVETPEDERRLWVIDQQINDRGVMLDVQMVSSAIAMDQASKERLSAEATAITGLQNPNSATQLKAWLSEEIDIPVESLTKESIKDLLQGDHNDQVMQILRTRQEMAKTSVKKYQAMAAAICQDGRVRGLLQFYGANRTGRWAGRLVQVQNLPQNHISDLDLARSVVRSGDLELLAMLYGNVPDALSQLIRTAFIAPKGHRFIVADFSAIEARVIAWLADEAWRLEVFNTHGKIYEASAAAMFRVPMGSIHKGDPLRQKGKVAELALGYQGGPGALVAMGALKIGLSEDELPELVDSWRNANKAIVRLWSEVGKAAIKAVANQTAISIRHGVQFTGTSGRMLVTLPSGRKLCYHQPRLVTNQFGSSAVQYEGMNQTTKQWGKQDTYGGKLVENIVQAIARDCLAVSMTRLHDADYRAVMHIHDEVVLETPDDFGSLENVCEIMGRPIEWAPGLPLRADGYETPYYKKD